MLNLGQNKMKKSEKVKIGKTKQIVGKERKMMREKVRTRKMWKILGKES